jgi:hypothetical protein
MFGAIIAAFAGILSADPCDSIWEVGNTCAGMTVINAPAELALQPPPQQQQPAIAKDLFLSTWWGYHAAFAADFTTTAMIISSGGHEGDPVYTAFGDRNMAGVIGSAVVFHAAASFISFQLYKAAQRRHGAGRFILNATATGLNSCFLGIHTYAAINNVKLYNTMGK